MSRPLLLLVDDAPEIGLIVERLAKRGGQEVVSCSDAAVAWDYLEQTRPSVARMPAPDLVLLDINLPGINGAEFCSRLKTTPNLAGLRVALFSHWDRPEDIAAGWDAGADFVVSKDLLCRAADWQERLQEILRVTNGRIGGPSLSWSEAERPSPSAEGCRILLTNAARQIGPAVVQAVIRRALRHAGLALPKGGLARDWFAPDWSLLAPDARPGTMAVFLASVVEQLWSLLGTSGGAPLWQLLAHADPFQGTQSS